MEGQDHADRLTEAQQRLTAWAGSMGCVKLKRTLARFAEKVFISRNKLNAIVLDSGSVNADAQRVLAVRNDLAELLMEEVTDNIVMEDTIGA